MVFLDVLLKCRKVWLIAGNPGVRGQACLAFGRKTRFLELNNGAAVESRKFCNNSATHPVHKRKKKNRKRLPTAKDFSMGNFHSERLRFCGPVIATGEKTGTGQGDRYDRHTAE